MAGQPSVFDFAVVTATEAPTRAPQALPYFIVEAGDTLSLQAYFHCGGDATTRGHINEVMTNAGTPPKVTYYFQDLQGGAAIAPIVQAGAVTQLPQATVDGLFRGAGPLVGSDLDATDDYYAFPLQPITTGNFAGPNLVVLPGATGTWRVLITLYGVDATGTINTAFDDNLIIQVIG